MYQLEVESNKEIQMDILSKYQNKKEKNQQVSKNIAKKHKNVSLRERIKLTKTVSKKPRLMERRSRK